MENNDKPKSESSSFDDLMSGSDIDETLANAPVERMIGKYPVMHKLGQGAMGEVWLGRHPDLDIPVAVKTLPQHLANRDDAYVDRFMREAKAAARINHTNVVRVYDCGVDDGVHFIVMEYVDGGDVKKMQSQCNGPMPITQALEVVVAVAEALKEAAAFKIVHRDVKPENIMVDSRGTVKLADLGLAKIKEDVEDTGMTQTGATVGSPKYIAPEQVKNSKSADHRADIYSLGATFYHLVTGEAPFHAESSFEMMLKHVEEPLKHPREINPDLPDDVCRVILKMTEKKPEDRYQTADDLLTDLNRLVRVHVQGDVASAIIAPRRQVVGKGAILLAAVTIMVAAGIAVKLIPSSKPDPEVPTIPKDKVGTPDTGKSKPMVKVTAGMPFTLPELKLDMVPILAGTFKMGWDEGRRHEGPRHTVTLSTPFWMGKTEVTYGQFEVFAKATEFRTDAERAGQSTVFIQEPGSVRTRKEPGASWKTVAKEPNRPVVCVSWNDASAFCQWLTSREEKAGRLPAGFEYRLPTEAEWEYACRADTDTRYYWGDEYKARHQYEWFNHESWQPNLVGEYKPNPWGLHDMMGNVFELCLDQAEYKNSAVATDTFKDGVIDPVGLKGERRMTRGSAWMTSRNVNVFARSSVDQRFSSASIGFRIVLAKRLTDKLPE